MWVFAELGGSLLAQGFGSTRVILGLYWDNGKENGNYYHGVIQGLYWGYIGSLSSDGVYSERQGI